MYRINSDHESKNIVESKLLPLTYKGNISVKETALREKVEEIT